jgi:hypothetical protein
MDDETFTGCISKECVQDEGSFTTGLTLNVFRGTKANLQQALPNCHPDTAVVGALVGLLPEFVPDPRLQILNLEPCVQRTAGSRLIRVQYRKLGPMRPDMVYHFVIEFDQSPDMYLFTFASPESGWDDSWKIGKQILTNLVFSPSPSIGLIFSIEPLLGPDDLLQAKVLEVGRSLGWSLAHEDRDKGLFSWRIKVEVPRAGARRSSHAGTFTWCMKRAANEIKLQDSIDLVPLDDVSVDLMEGISAAARELQEDFKRRWLALVGPVTLQPASPEMVDLSVRAAIAVIQAALPKT